MEGEGGIVRVRSWRNNGSCLLSGFVQKCYKCLFHSSYVKSSTQNKVTIETLTDKSLDLLFRF